MHSAAITAVSAGPCHLSLSIDPTAQPLTCSRSLSTSCVSLLAAAACAAHAGLSGIPAGAATRTACYYNWTRAVRAGLVCPLRTAAAACSSALRGRGASRPAVGSRGSKLMSSPSPPMSRVLLFSSMAPTRGIVAAAAGLGGGWLGCAEAGCWLALAAHAPPLASRRTGAQLSVWNSATCASTRTRRRRETTWLHK
jgi:hypothetical protein|eukprot:COSAG01_NODE_2724_length_7183_cov_4.796414_1_plen_196_part_00